MTSTLHPYRDAGMPTPEPPPKFIIIRTAKWETTKGLAVEWMQGGGYVSIRITDSVDPTHPRCVRLTRDEAQELLSAIHYAIAEGWPK